MKPFRTKRHDWKPGYKIEPLSFNRRAVIASASVTGEKDAIHSLAEVDITLPRALIRRYAERTGLKLSFTAYLVACLAHVMREFRHFNAFIQGRKLVILDDLTISVLVEREVEGELVPEPMAIQQAQAKTALQIHQEIRQTNKQGTDQLGKLATNPLLNLLPTFLLKILVRLAERNITMAQRYGKVAVTAVGMFSKEPAWFIPHGTATVLLTVGSISHKVVLFEGELVSHEHLCLTISFDHHIVDGAPAARFTSRLLETIRSAEILEKELFPE